MWRPFLAFVSFLTLGPIAALAQTAPVHFGAKLDSFTQPSNAGHGIFCNVGTARPDCSWVLMQAYQCEFGNCVKGHLAPQDGVIASVSLIACFPGSFVLQIATAKPKAQQAAVITSGPLITYNGDSHHCRRSKFDIETFPVNVEVKKGDYLAVATQKLGFVRCSGGGNNILLFDPPLPDGGALRPASGGEGCFMLLEAEYAPVTPK
jgi:hypothetical protein